MKTQPILALATALLIAGPGAGFAQNAPSAPEPAKSAPLDTGAKPEPTKPGGGGASADVAPGATTTKKKAMSHHSKRRRHR